MIMRKIFTICLVILMSIQTFAQDITSYQSLGLFPHTVTYAAHSNVPFDGPEIFVQSHFVTDVSYGVKVLNVENDELGFTHYRLQQTLNGHPVEKSMLLVHVKDGKVVSTNGEWFKTLPGKKTPALKADVALARALDKVKAKQYIWETEEAQNRAAMRIKESGAVSFEKPTGELVYMNVGNELSAASLKLAYKFDIFSVDPFAQEDVYIDAENGNVIFSVSQMHQANTNGTAQTGYYGAKSITVDHSGNYYARQSGTRRIELYNMNGATVPQNGSRPSGSTVASSSSNFSFSGNAKYYMDAYWGAEVTFDLFQEKFNRNSYNNAGGKIDMFVNGSGQGASNNAFWYGSFAYFGNSTSGTPFTSLDVVSHEITHGVTGNSARLIYQGESGALNEAFSDIFGCYAEHYAGVGQKWIMGEYISFQRSMSNPNQHRQPDTYRGSYWASTSGGDNGGVHTNSGVMNYWYYLVSEGGSGSNDNGASFSVDAIGIEKASQIAYRALTSYLTSSSGYSAARTAVINAARDLYGNNSCEVAAATDAMHAVGVGSAFSGNCSGQECSPLTGLSVSSITTSGATVSWNAVSGISSYTLEYKPTSSSSYTSVTANSASRTLSGLSASTTYDVRVRYTCSNGTTADYASTTFTTQSGGGSCNAVTGLSVSGVTTSGATISWNAVSGVSSYSVGYKLASGSTYTTTSASGTSTTLSGLSAGQDYDVRVNYTCSNGQAAPYSSSSFTTSTTGGGDCDGLPSWTSSAYYYQGDRVVYNNSIYEALYFIYYYPPTDTRYWTKVSDCGGGGTCAALTGLGVSSIGQTSAVVSWNGVSGISSYSVEYKLASASNYTTTSSSSSSISLSGLTPNSTYTVRVRYTCTNGQTAAYSSTSFTTAEDTSPGCDAVTGLTATSITQNSAQLSWNGVSGVSSYTLDYKATADANYQSATINGTSEPYTGLSANTSYSIRVSYTCSNGQTSPLATHQFTTTGSSGGGCSGVETYQSGKYYHTGDRVVYQGNLYEAQANYIYWPPSYGWWTYISACQSATSAFGAIEDNFNPPGEMSTFNIYPNATRERVNVQFVGEQDDVQSTIRMIDTSGNLILDYQLDTHKGLNQVTLDLPSVDPGVYFIQHNGEIKRILIK